LVLSWEDTQDTRASDIAMRTIDDNAHLLHCAECIGPDIVCAEVIMAAFFGSFEQSYQSYDTEEMFALLCASANTEFRKSCVQYLVKVAEARINLEYDSLWQQCRKLISDLELMNAHRDFVEPLNDFVAAHHVPDIEAAHMVVRAAEEIASVLPNELVILAQKLQADAKAVEVSEIITAEVYDILDFAVRYAVTNSDQTINASFAIFKQVLRLSEELDEGYAEEEFTLPVHAVIRDFPQFLSHKQMFAMEGSKDDWQLTIISETSQTAHCILEVCLQFVAICRMCDKIAMRFLCIVQMEK